MKHKKEKKEECLIRDNFPKGLKWIYVSLVINFNNGEKKIEKKEIEKIATDIVEIINNTHGVINENGHYVGYFNNPLNVNLASLPKCKNGKITNVTNFSERIFIPKFARTFFPKNFPDGKGILPMNLSRFFYAIIEKIDNGWRLSFIPESTNKEHKINLYSIENLNADIWMLAGASNLICEKYDIIIENEIPTYSPVILGGCPAIELHDHLLIIRYHVHDRISYYLKDKKLAKFILGNGESILKTIKKISRKQKDSEWTKKVEKVISKREKKKPKNKGKQKNIKKKKKKSHKKD